MLSRIAGLFSGRGYNIENLSVNTTLDPTVSRITLQSSGDEGILEQITKQLNKLVSVIKVVDMSEADHVERELALIKVTADSKTRAEVMNIAAIFRAKIVDVGPKDCIVEITGDDEKIEAITKLLCATHKCDAKVFNAELIKLVGSQGAQLRAKQRARRPASMPERHHHCPAPLAPSR